MAAIPVLVVSGDGFEDTQSLVPWYRLREAEIDVHIASRVGTFSGTHGYEEEAELGLGDVQVQTYDLLWLVGGKVPAKLREDQRLLELARSYFASDKRVAATCHGPQIRVVAGLLKGRTATGYKTVSPELKPAGADHQDRELALDGNLITARQPGRLASVYPRNHGSSGVSAYAAQR